MALDDPSDAHRVINARRVREICGGISDMTLWRRLHDATLGFPKPIMIARRRYWRESDVVEWLEAQRRAT